VLAFRRIFPFMASPADELDSDLLGELTEFRRDLHAHPELGFQETRTAGRVAAALRAWGSMWPSASAAPES
jgi:metal-dependent amidase/aminoacylase/carboxypeptidase family protein